MILDPILDLFRGKAITIPPLDGAFRPNTRLDDAPLFARLEATDNLVVLNGRLLASSGPAIFALDPDDAPILLETFPASVTALAVSPSGDLAVGLETGALIVAGRPVEGPPGLRCITALAFGPDASLWLANGSADHAPSAWSADLMQHGASGSVWTRDAGAAAFRKVAGGLAYPNGLHPTGDGGVIVSESWRHRLLRVSRSGGRETVMDHLPGYPARLSPSADGGLWLSIFAPRNRLIEFVLAEKYYREEMIASVPRAYWIAPALASNSSFLEPLQCGSIKTMGIHKPWSPTRSYGLVARLDRSLRPIDSVHSRANGTRHGTCSAVEWNGRVFVGAKGGNAVLAVDLAEDASS